MRANLDAHILSPRHSVAPGPPARTAAANPSLRGDLNWGDIYKSLTQPAAAPATTTPSAPCTPFANFGSTPNGPDATGGQTYNPMSNPLLTPQTSSTDINGTLVTQNTSPTVTAAAAQQFAAVLGGTVVQVQTPWSNSAPVYGIEMPGGAVIDGTAIANILGNNAAYPSAAVKSGEIAKLAGIQYTPALANLATQLASGANASVQPVNAGPGVMSSAVLTTAGDSGAA